MISRDGRLKVLDFGLARMLDADVGATRTLEAPVSEVGVAMGTIPYMAPEQIRGDAVDARADLFAFGVIVYELATGKRPFHGPSLADVSSAILRDAPAPLRAQLPSGLAQIVERCLAKNPRDRFQSAIDLAHELRKVQPDKAGAPAAIHLEVETVYRLLGETLILEGPESDKALRELIDHHAKYGPAQIAQAYTARGDVENAFAWIERAKNERDPGLMQMLPDPLFRPLHADPRWAELRRWLGIE
jgi:serine/threonine protein kinase